MINKNNLQKNKRNYKKRKNIQITYFSNGFIFIAQALQKYFKEYKVTYEYAPAGKFEILKNIFLIKKKIFNREFAKYDVVHLGNWETNLFFKKIRKDQIYVAHAHGFYVGVNFDQTIVELPFIKRQVSKLIKLFFDKKMKKQLRSADVFYVSTPNMLEPAKKEVRKDAIWLPNPIDMTLMNPNGEKKILEGNPAVFLPTRIHAFKNPLFAAELFKKIKAKYPEAKLHIINYRQGADPLYKEFMKIVFDEKDVISHNKMKKQELFKFYRGSDLVLGQFNENLGVLGLIELEAMACGATLVSLDKYERKWFLKDLEAIAFKLLEDKEFKKKYVQENMSYVKKVHSEVNVAKMHNNNVKKLLRR